MEQRGIRAKVAVLPLALAFLLCAVACDLVGDEVVEVVGERTVHKGLPALESSEASRLASCGGDLVNIWGDRSGAVAWSRGPSGDEIVFSMGLEVYAVGADGRGLRMLSEAEGESGSAGTTALDVSPDGLQVVYTPCESLEGFSGSEHELAVARLDGGAVRQLTENTHFEKYPSWSPDGKRIAFVSSGVTPGMIYEWDDVHLYSMAADGTDVRRIAEGPLVHETPRWSPDGERIAYAVFEDRGLGQPPAIYIHVVGSDGGTAQRLTDAASGPTWSPDGERIAYAKADGDDVALYTIAVDGTDARRLAAIEGWHLGRGGPDPAKAWISKVSWSPDGSRILVLANKYVHPQIHVIGVDESDLPRLAMRNPGHVSIEDASWSPDGTRIAMVGDFGRQGADDPTKWIALLTIGADGTGLRVLVGRRDDGSLAGLDISRGDISADVACREGVAVPDPDANAGLVEDCEALLEVQNALTGPGGLNWLVERDIREWDGVVVEGTPLRVRELTLIRRGLVGEIPRELGRLAELRVLAMGTNALMGEIPAELGEFKNLERLDLSLNYLSGEIPAELGGLGTLTRLWLDSNNLRGRIPVELSELGGLTHLSLGSNSLEGEIPAELSEFGELIHLSLAGNNLEGQIPSELGELKGLTHLSLAGNNLTGEIPAELGRLTRLERLHLQRNRLTGEIPAELGQLTNIKELIFTIGAPAELGLVDNRFTGCIPEGLREVENTDAGTLGLPDC